MRVVLRGAAGGEKPLAAADAVLAQRSGGAAAGREGALSSCVLERVSDSPQDPRALHSIASVCGIPDRRLRCVPVVPLLSSVSPGAVRLSDGRSALLEVLQRPDLPYRARARALKSLGKQVRPLLPRCALLLTPRSVTRATSS
jgi:hypothetical protein